MKRLVRLWGKKRGTRRTGSHLAGTLGEAAFFGSLFLLGLVSLASLIASQIIAPSAELFQIGWGTWLVLLVLVTFLLIGGGGLFLSVWELGASVERRSALVRRAADIELIREVRSRHTGLPNVPRGSNLTNSPGVKLAYRLPSLESPAWHLSALAVTSLLCLLLDALLIAVAIRSVHLGKPQYALMVFLVPLTAVTVWSTVYFIRQLLAHTWIGPTRVEISAHPLYPGRRYEVCLFQGGHIRVKSLALQFVCNEEVIYRQGTDLRTEQRCVYSQQLFEKHDFVIDPSCDFQVVVPFTVPPEAMHSFQSPHNSVLWMLEVIGQFPRWPPLRRRFPVVVYPSTEVQHGASDQHPPA
ncbi:MAG: hypothetical protein KatS3mg110_0353 [Pirellulaceae bacterium]|nr:MAG: hypothetical protein KatS3mg110_0353 [Pirellulaceae bacterium]